MKLWMKCDVKIRGVLFYFLDFIPKFRRVKRLHISIGDVGRGGRVVCSKPDVVVFGNIHWRKIGMHEPNMPDRKVFHRIQKLNKSIGVPLSDHTEQTYLYGVIECRKG